MNLAWNGLATHISRLSPGARTAALTITLGNAAFIGLALVALTAPTVAAGTTIGDASDPAYATNVSHCLSRDGWQSTPGGGGSVTINYLETQRAAFSADLTACLTSYGYETP